MLKFGVDIGGTKVAGAAIDAAGRDVATARLPNPRGDYAGTIAAVRDVVAEVGRAAGTMPERLGVCVSGNVVAASGEVRLGTARWINHHPFRDDIAAATAVPVRLANDADCFALSEAVDGAGAGARSVFGVIIGTGVGGGFVVDGRLIAGKQGIAGEWGHVPLPRASAAELAAGPCSCGRHGCIETLLAGPSLAADFARETGIGRDAAPDARALAERAAAGDAAAEAALGRYEERLGRALAMLVNILEPDVIVLGGGLSNLARIYVNTPSLIAPHVFGDRLETALLRNAHGDSSGVRGAARLWD